MKKLLIALAICVAIPVAAQDPFGARQESFSTMGYLRDYDSVTSVRCAYWKIKDYTSPQMHHEPPRDGQIWKSSTVTGRATKHICHNDNKLAQEVYLARLDKLREVRHKPLSKETEMIVYNFELLTGTHNSTDHNFVGTQYVSSMAMTAWEVWFNNHKERLRICSITRVLYIDNELTIREK